MKTQTAGLILVLSIPFIYLAGWFSAQTIDNFFKRRRNLKDRSKE